MRKAIIGLVALVFLTGTPALAHHNPNHDGGGGNENEVVTICHATGSADNPWQRLVVSENAIGGHFENNGTPKDGHEDDLLFEGEQNCPEPEDPPTCEDRGDCPPPPCETDCDPDPCDQDLCDDPQEPTTVFHFIKVVCADYALITGNAEASTHDASGHFMEFTNFPNFPVYPTVTNAEIHENCETAEDWKFKLSSDQDQLNDVQIVTTDDDGSADLNFSDFSTELQEALEDGQLWVSEVEQDGYGFGQLRCHNDALYGDNLEFLELDTFPEDIYCIAYNVTEDDGGGNRDPFTLTITTSGEGNGMVTGDGISCDSNFVEGEEMPLNDCEETYPADTEVELIVTVDEGSSFDNSWSTTIGNPGTCTTNTTPCTVTINGNVTLDAHFSVLQSSSSGRSGGGGNNDDDDNGLVQGDSITGLPYQAPGLVLGATTLPITGFDLGLFKVLLALPFLFLKRHESM